MLRGNDMQDYEVGLFDEVDEEAGLYRRCVVPMVFRAKHGALEYYEKLVWHNCRSEGKLTKRICV